MPGFDGTGPLAQGSFTGRGRGFCIVKIAAENAIPLAAKNSTNAISSNRTQVKEALKMPAGDRTGPAGMGPMTGRGAGYCAGSTVPGYQNQPGGFGRGGRGAGGGRGRRNWQNTTGLPGWQGAGAGMPAFGGQAYPQSAVEQNRELELQALKNQAAGLEDSLREIVGRIEQLESTGK